MSDGLEPGEEGAVRDLLEVTLTDVLQEKIIFRIFIMMMQT